MNKIIPLLILSVIPFIGFAQVDWENPTGAIQSEEIVIEKDKQLVLSTVSRRFSSITVVPLPIDTAAITYIPKNIQLELPQIPVKLRPHTMKSEALDKTYWGNFKVGYGSYSSPFVQADVASKRNDEYAVAMHLRHYSSKNGPIDKENSGLSNTDGYLSGKIFLNKATIGANLGASFDKYHLYGYDANTPIPESLAIEQKLNNYDISFNIADNDGKEAFYYKLTGGMQLFNASSLSWKENDFYVALRTDAELSDNLKLKVLGDFHLGTQNYSQSATSRLFYKLKPVVTYAMDNFDFELGAGVYGTKDSINNYESKIYITPHVVANYNFSTGQRVSAGVKGDVAWQSARTRFNENYYLGASTVINNNVKPIEVFIEATGKLAPKVDFKVGYNAAVYKVFGQFVNNASDESTFYLDYQEENNLLHTINGQLDFVSSKNLLFSIYGKYLIFNFKNIEQVYHMPQVDLGLKVKFKLEDKFVVEYTMAYLDGIYAFDNATTSDLKLNSILDMNISSSYRINSSISAFVRMQNILGNKYQYYNNYPTKGFQAMVGVSITL